MCTGFVSLCWNWYLGIMRKWETTLVNEMSFSQELIKNYVLKEGKNFNWGHKHHLVPKHIIFDWRVVVAWLYFVRPKNNIFLKGFIFCYWIPLKDSNVDNFGKKVKKIEITGLCYIRVLRVCSFSKRSGHLIRTTVV